MGERRFDHRIPFEMFLNEYVRERRHRCVSANLSESGLYLHKLVTPPARTGNLVQLEFELPGTNEVIWARGEVAFQRIDDEFHGTGVRLTGLPNAHVRLLREYILERRQRRRAGLLARIRKDDDRSLHFKRAR